MHLNPDMDYNQGDEKLPRSNSIYLCRCGQNLPYVTSVRKQKPLLQAFDRMHYDD